MSEEHDILSDETKIDQNLNWKEFKTLYQFKNSDEFKTSKIYDDYDEDQKLLIEALISEQLFQK